MATNGSECGSYLNLNKTDFDERTEEKPNDVSDGRTVCVEHGGRTLDRFCKNHSVLCCTACIDAYHRTCKISEISESSKKIRKSKDFKQFTSDLKHTKQKLSKLRHSRQEYQKRLRKETHEAVEEIKAFRKQIDWVLDRLERKGKEYLEKRYQSFTKTINDEIQTFDDMIADIETLQDQVNSTDDGAQLYGHMDTGNTTLEVSTKVCQDAKEAGVGPEIVQFSIDPKVKTFAMNLGWYGKDRTYLSFDPPLKLPHMYTVKHENQFDVRVKGDKNLCGVSDACQLQDGTIILADSTNKRIKQADVSYKIVDHCDIPGQPMAVCKTRDDEVAVAVNNGAVTSVQYIHVSNKLVHRDGFQLQHKCISLCFCNDQFVVSSSTGVHIYSDSGEFLKDIYKNRAGGIKHIAVSNDGRKIHITDMDEGLITVNADGELLSTFDDPKLKGVCGVAVDSQDQVFVCGEGTSNVFQLGHDNQKLGVLLSQTNGIKNPYSLCFDRFQNRLIVTRCGHNTIKVVGLK